MRSTDDEWTLHEHDPASVVLRPAPRPRRGRTPIPLRLESTPRRRKLVHVNIAHGSDEGTGHPIVNSLRIASHASLLLP